MLVQVLCAAMFPELGHQITPCANQIEPFAKPLQGVLLNVIACLRVEFNRSALKTIQRPEPIAEYRGRRLQRAFELVDLLAKPRGKFPILLLITGERWRRRA